LLGRDDGRADELVASDGIKLGARLSGGCVLGNVDVDGLSIGREDGRADELGDSDGIKLGIELFDGCSLGDVDNEGLPEG